MSDCMILDLPTSLRYTLCISSDGAGNMMNDFVVPDVMLLLSESVFEHNIVI